MRFFTSWFYDPTLERLQKLQDRVSILEDMCKNYEELLADQGQHCANYAEAYFVLQNFVKTLKGKKATLSLSDAQRAFVGADPHKYIMHRADVLKNILPVNYNPGARQEELSLAAKYGETKHNVGCTRIDCYADYPHGSH